MQNRVFSIEYKLTEVGSDQIIDSSTPEAPLTFISGLGHIIPGLERELLSLSKGDNTNIEVKSEDAYGQRDPNATNKLPKEQFAGLELEKGLTLYGQSEDGSTVSVVVIDFDDESVTVDYNHPLAGKDLNFWVNVLDARDATKEEIESGQVGGTHGDGSCGSGCGCS